ncbi:hypothetical protein ACFX2A_031281 [Malus domestica]
MVKSLICQDSGEWDIDFLKPFLAKVDFEAILGTQNGDLALRDRLVWPYKKKGSYSIKSGYYWNLNHNTGKIPSPIMTTNCLGALWKIIWKLEAPLKIRNFMWRTMHEAIVTMANLYQRQSSPSLLCPICKSHDESIEHMFLKCPWIDGVWFGGTLNIRANRLQDSNWVDWLLQMFKSTIGSKEVHIMLLSYIAFTCWHIWKSRYDFLFNNLILNPRRVLVAISLSVSAFKESIPSPGVE